jgi:aspartate-semialdehyde dehydrogenase
MPDEVAEAVDVFVGRVRKDMGDPSGRSVAMLLSSGRCRDERARSAVQVAEVLCARTLI